MQNGVYNLLEGINMTDNCEPQTSTPLKFSYHTSNSDNCDAMLDDDKQKATRFLGNKAVSVLLKWFHVNRDYPYPDEATTEYLAKEADISCKQVKKWFANKRVRSQLCCKSVNRTKKRSFPGNETSVNTESLTSPKTPLNRVNMYQPSSSSSSSSTSSNAVPTTPIQYQLNVMRQMAFYNPILMMNMLARVQQQQQQSPLVTVQNQDITNVKRKLENSTGSTSTSTSESLNQSNLANDVHLSSPYASSISSSSSSSNSTPNTQISLNSYNQQKNALHNLIADNKKFEKKINFACISSLVD